MGKYPDYEPRGCRWCMDDEEPECNGPDCGHAGTCRYYKGLMEEDDFFVKLLEEYNMKKELLLMSRHVGSKAHRAFMKLTSKDGAQ